MTEIFQAPEKQSISIEALYESLSSRNPQLKEHGFDNFKADMNDEKNLSALYESLSSRNAQLKERGFDSFKADMFGGMQPEKEAMPKISATENLHSSIPYVRVDENNQNNNQVIQSIPDTSKDVSFNPNSIPKIGSEKNIQNVIPQQETLREKYFDPALENVGGAKITSSKNEEYPKFTDHPIDYLGAEYEDFLKSTGHNLQIAGAEISKAIVNDIKNPLFPGTYAISAIGDQVINDWQKSIPKDRESAGTSAGQIIPYIGLGLATIFQPELAPATTAAFFAMGQGEGLNHAEEIEKETGTPMSEWKKQSYGIGYGAALSVPWGSMVNHLVPAPVKKYAIGMFMKSSPQLIEGLEGTLKSFIDKTPTGIGKVLNVGKQYVGGMAKSALGMEAMDLGKQGTNKLMGEDVGLNQILDGVKQSISSGAIFESVLFPFSRSRQIANIQQRREHQRTVAVGIVDGNPAEIYQSGNEYFAVRPDGTIKKAKAEDYNNSIIIPTDVFNETIKTGKISPTIQRDVYSGRITDMLNRISDSNGNVFVAQDKEGNPFYVVGKDKKGNTTAVDTNGVQDILDPSLPIQRVSKGDVYNALISKFDQKPENTTQQVPQELQPSQTLNPRQTKEAELTQQANSIAHKETGNVTIGELTTMGSDNNIQVYVVSEWAEPDPNDPNKEIKKSFVKRIDGQPFGDGQTIKGTGSEMVVRRKETSVPEYVQAGLAEYDKTELANQKDQIVIDGQKLTLTGLQTKEGYEAAASNGNISFIPAKIADKVIGTGNEIVTRMYGKTNYTGVKDKKSGVITLIDAILPDQEVTLRQIVEQSTEGKSTIQTEHIQNEDPTMPVSLQVSIVPTPTISPEVITPESSDIVVDNGPQADEDTKAQAEVKPPYSYKGEEITPAEAKDLVELAILKGNKSKLDGLEYANDPKIDELIKKAWPKPIASFTIGKKKITTAQAKSHIKFSDNIDELNEMKFENIESEPDIAQAYQDKLKQFTPEQITENANLSEPKPENTEENQLQNEVDPFDVLFDNSEVSQKDQPVVDENTIELTQSSEVKMPGNQVDSKENEQAQNVIPVIVDGLTENKQLEKEEPISEKDNTIEESGETEQENSEMSAEEEAEGIEQAQKLTDFGVKIGMARKDVSEKGFSRIGKGKEESQPTWAKKYKVFDQKNMAVVERIGWNRPALDPEKFTIAIVKGNQFRTIRENVSTEQEAYDMIPFIEVAINHRIYPSEKNKEEFSIYRKWSSGKLFEIKKGFESKDAAMRYMAEHPQEIINYKTARVERPHLDSIERTGPERRKGNVTPDQFMKAFGLRAGEFGNWVAGDERQEMLNFAYDAFADMAEVLGVPYKAISLNGRLAIGFGSRGQGLSGASAHFEPQRGVINLTKINGAGALAHEWFHAFDSYLGIKDRKGYEPNEAGVITSIKDERDYNSQNSNNKLRDELRKAWRGVWEEMRYKSEQSTYDKGKAEKRRNYAIESLMNGLNSAFASAKVDRSYGLRKKAATPEQIKRWDVLIERVKNFDFGEVTEKKTKKRYSFEKQYDVQKQLNDLYKEITGREMSTYNMSYNNFKGIELYNEEIQRAEEGQTFENKVPTTFYRDSVEMDKVRASSYWSTNHEMSARAFEAFMDDQIKATGFKNDYLVHSVNNGIYQMLYDCKPYPEGEERSKINEAFNGLFSTIETKEEGDNVPMFSKDASVIDYSDPDKPTVEQMQSKINELQSIAPGAAPVTLIKSLDELPEIVRNHADFNGDVEAVWYKGQIYILPNKIRSIDHLIQTWIHENGIHNGLRNIIPAGEIKQFMNTVYDSFIEIGKENPEFQEIIDRINTDYSSFSSDRKAEEFLAYLSEKVVNEEDLTPMEESAWRKYLTMFRNWLRRLFNFKSDLLTEEQITEVTRFAVQSNFQENELANSNQGGRGSLRKGEQRNADGSEGGINESGKLQNATVERLSSEIRQGGVLSGNRAGQVDRSLPLTDYLAQAKQSIQEKKANQPKNTIPEPAMFAKDKSEPLMDYLKKAKEFISEKKKFIPGVTETAETAKEFSEAIKTTLSPTTQEEGAKLASESMRSHLGSMQRSLDMATQRLIQAKRRFDKMTNEENLTFIDNMEHDLPQETEELQRYSDALRDALDSSRERVRELGTGKLEIFVENYFPHYWVDKNKAASLLTGVGSRQFEGSKGFLKLRTIEFTKDGVKKGLVPVSWNPVKLALMKIREMERYTMAHATLNELKHSGYVKFIRMGESMPEGFTKIHDNVGTVMRLNENTHMFELLGNYYAEENAARIINNFLSRGLRGNAAYDIYRGLGNAITQFQLGLSAFHLGFTSMDAAISKQALGWEYLYHGNVVEALKHFALTPFAPITNIGQGSRLRHAWMGDSGNRLMNSIFGSPSTPEMKMIAEFMEQAGGRAKMDDFYREGWMDKIQENVRNHRYIKATLQVPLQLVELASKPILEFIVPRQKLGVFMDMVRYDLKVNPKSTLEERRVAMQKAWDSVDNRMGQLVYDNLFWNHVTKDIAMATVRSVGWNLGTFREVGGAPKQAVDVIWSAAHGKTAVNTHKLGYMISLVITTAISSAIFQYLRTGTAPEEPKDYLFPKDGGIDKNGDDTRVSMPSYMKDLYHYGNDFPSGALTTLKNKLSPVNGIVVQMFSNKDYYGTKVYNEDDSTIDKTKDIFSYLGQQLVPFGIRNAKNNNSDQMADKVLPFIGIVPAPYDLNMTEAEKKIADIIRDKMPVGGRTKEQSEHSKVKSELRNEYLKTKDKSLLRAAFDRKEINVDEYHSIIMDSKSTPIQRNAKRLNVTELFEIYKIASPEEQKMIKPILKKKMINRRKAGDLNQVERDEFIIIKNALTK